MVRFSELVGDRDVLMPATLLLPISAVWFELK
jgi:hypothetical protein